MPTCASVIRRRLPLLTAFKSRLTSLLRTLGARFSPSGRSGYFRFFGRSGGDASDRDANPEHIPDSDEGFGLKLLPQIPKGVHQMKTARAFMWGSKKHTETTTDDEETEFANWRS